MTLVLKVNCRACNRECGDYKHLMSETLIDEEATTLAALLTYCTSVDCLGDNELESMPDHICNSCVEHLLQSYLFKEMVLHTDRSLREHFGVEQEAEKVCEPQEAELNLEPCGLLLEEVAEQDIDVGGVEEEECQSLEPTNEIEDCMDKEEVVEFEMEEWLEMDENGVTGDPEEQIKNEPQRIDGSSETEANAEEDEVEDENFVYLQQTYQLEDELEKERRDGDMQDSGKEELDTNEPKEKEKKVTRKKFMKPGGLTADDLKCKYCGKQFDKYCRMREHTYIHTGEKPHVCKICGKRSRTKTHHNVHLLTHSDEKRYSCATCGLTYRTSTSLRVHERKHADIRLFECTMCDKKFHTSDQRKLHIMLHTGERPHSCDICGKAYREAHSLRQHMLTHEDKKPFQCEVCGKGLTQMSGYKRHMLLHTNEYPYTCDICGRPFRISSNLLAHKRLHQNEQPFPCPKCDKTFTFLSKLKKHMASHEENSSANAATFKPRKPRQESIIVDAKMCKSRVVEIL